MKMTSVWRGNKPARPKKRSVPKLRIPWVELGLIDPAVGSPETPMEQIRREVTALASIGFGAETRARSEQTSARSRPRPAAARPARRKTGA